MSEVPNDYYTYRFSEEEKYIQIIQILKELENAFLKINYVYGGLMWFFGLLYYFDKSQSSTFSADNINNIINFLQKYIEFVEVVLK